MGDAASNQVLPRPPLAKELVHLFQIQPQWEYQVRGCGFASQLTNHLMLEVIFGSWNFTQRLGCRGSLPGKSSNPGESGLVPRGLAYMKLQSATQRQTIPKWRIVEIVSPISCNSADYLLLFPLISGATPTKSDLMGDWRADKDFFIFRMSVNLKLRKSNTNLNCKVPASVHPHVSNTGWMFVHTILH